ncbi:hypothetical protein DP49_3981 [Burkholderia pseudomallei]|nr:hypothetical protein DP49_3981 [Burkholderia pseudomallei]
MYFGASALSDLSGRTAIVTRASPSIAHGLANEARRAQGEHGISRYAHCLRRTVDALKQLSIDIYADFSLSRAALRNRAWRLHGHIRRRRCRSRIRRTGNECGNGRFVLRKRRFFRNGHVNPYLIDIFPTSCRYLFDIDMMSVHRLARAPLARSTTSCTRSISAHATVSRRGISSTCSPAALAFENALRRCRRHGSNSMPA